MSVGKGECYVCLTGNSQNVHATTHAVELLDGHRRYQATKVYLNPAQQFRAIHEEALRKKCQMALTGRTASVVAVGPSDAKRSECMFGRGGLAHLTLSHLLKAPATTLIGFAYSLRSMHDEHHQILDLTTHDVLAATLKSSDSANAPLGPVPAMAQPFLIEKASDALDRIPSGLSFQTETMVLKVFVVTTVDDAVPGKHERKDLMGCVNFIDICDNHIHMLGRCVHSIRTGESCDIARRGGGKDAIVQEDPTYLTHAQHVRDNIFKSSSTACFAFVSPVKQTYVFTDRVLALAEQFVHLYQFGTPLVSSVPPFVENLADAVEELAAKAVAEDTKAKESAMAEGYTAIRSVVERLRKATIQKYASDAMTRTVNLEVGKQLVDDNLAESISGWEEREAEIQAKVDKVNKEITEWQEGTEQTLELHEELRKSAKTDIIGPLRENSLYRDGDETASAERDDDILTEPPGNSTADVIHADVEDLLPGAFKKKHDSASKKVQRELTRGRADLERFTNIAQNSERHETEDISACCNATQHVFVSDQLMYYDTQSAHINSMLEEALNKASKFQSTGRSISRGCPGGTHASGVSTIGDVKLSSMTNSTASGLHLQPERRSESITLSSASEDSSLTSCQSSEADSSTSPSTDAAGSKRGSKRGREDEAEMVSVTVVTAAGKGGKSKSSSRAGSELQAVAANVGKVNRKAPKAESKASKTVKARAVRA